MLQLDELTKKYNTGELALKGVTLDIPKGQVLALIGPSGAGKSTLIRCVNRLVQPTSGSVVLKGTELTKLSSSALRKARRRMGMIFQEYALVERLTVMENVLSGRLGYVGFWRSYFRKFPSADVQEAYRLLDRVGLKHMADKRADELSGGQRQRVGIARALSVNPKFIVCDEAVSALDVSIQAQIINLLEDLQTQFNFSYLFIAHDLSVVRHLCHRVAVMYLGKIVELADCDELFDNPQHPYTKALLSAVPVPDPAIEEARSHQILEGEVPSPIAPPSGCVFHPRCPQATEACRRDIPTLQEFTPGHTLACPIVLGQQR